MQIANWSASHQFLLFVNDMPRVVENASKCYKVINQESDFVNLQRDLVGQLVMSFCFSLLNALICIFLENAIVRHSPSRNYSLNGIGLEVV